MNIPLPISVCIRTVKNRVKKQGIKAPPEGLIYQIWSRSEKLHLQQVPSPPPPPSTLVILMWVAVEPGLKMSCFALTTWHVSSTQVCRNVHMLHDTENTHTTRRHRATVHRVYTSPYQPTQPWARAPMSQKNSNFTRQKWREVLEYACTLLSALSDFVPFLSCKTCPHRVK